MPLGELLRAFVRTILQKWKDCTYVQYGAYVRVIRLKGRGVGDDKNEMADSVYSAAISMSHAITYFTR